MLGTRAEDTVLALSSFPGRNQISYDWIAADAPDRAARWPGPPVDDAELPVQARTVVLATGVAWRRLGTPGFERLLGKGVHYGASRSEAVSTQGRDIHLIGAGNSAGRAALFFASHARSVTLVVRGDDLERSMSHYLIEQVRGKPNIRVALRAEVTAAHGEKELSAIDVLDRATANVQRVASGGA